MRGYFTYLSHHGFRSFLMAPDGDAVSRAAERENIDAYTLAARPALPPIRMLRWFGSSLRVMSALQPDIVNAITPAAGAIGLLAARLVGVDLRMYVVRELRYERTVGLRAALHGWIEWFTCRQATVVVCVSASMRDVYEERGYAPARKLTVLGKGSSNGVDVEHFSFDPGHRAELREELDIEDNQPVIGFVGRLAADKGIADLISTFSCLRSRGHDCTLLIVGGLDDADPIGNKTAAKLSSSGIRWIGALDDPARIYSAMDLLLFPSYREGLPNAVLEAASSGRPCVAYDVTGTRDAIVNGETGLLVKMGSVPDLVLAVEQYLLDEQLRHRHGSAAKRFVSREFSQERVWAELVDLYLSSLSVEARR